MTTHSGQTRGRRSLPSRQRHLCLSWFHSQNNIDHLLLRRQSKGQVASLFKTTPFRSKGNWRPQQIVGRRIKVWWSINKSSWSRKSKSATSSKNTNQRIS